MSNRRERREKFIATMAEPEVLEIFCDRISDGATMGDLSRELSANFRWLHEWFNDPEFPERREMLLGAEAARDALAKEDIIGQLHRLANIDIRDIYDDAGNVKSIKNMPAHIAKAISSIDVVENEKGEMTKKIRFVDRGQMLALGGRRQKMFVDKMEVVGQMSLEQAVMESVKPRE